MKSIFSLLVVFLLGGCLTTYNPDINQGNILTLKEIAQLEVGMSQEQVRDLLGSPSIIDVFHNNRWDYINQSYLLNAKDISVHLILEFDKNKLLKEIIRKNITQVEH